MILSRPFISVLSVLIAVCSTAGTARGATDKSGYSLNNPVPAALLREMSTDRPDATESPFTVDAGHLQIEADLASHTRNRLEGVRSREWSVGTTNLRLGVSNSAELGLFVTPWMRHADEAASSPRAVYSGFGDVMLRAKWNAWGNDGGKTAGGIIVDLKLPMAAEGLGNDSLEGTVTLPVAVQLGFGWEFGAMTALDLRRNESDTGYIAVLVTTATVGHAITDKIDGYVELTSEAGDGAHVATFDFGLTYSVNNNTQLDCGANIGISHAADDLQVFAGITRRF
jgi:hypothetical protein